MKRRTYTLLLTHNARGPRRWRWALRASNGWLVAQSAMPFRSKYFALTNFNRLGEHLTSNPIYVEEQI